MMVKYSCTEMFIISNTRVYGKYILQPPQSEKYNINSSTRYCNDEVRKYGYTYL
jgi:hypothetical protein